jgi:phosphatidylglycerophosphatase A
MRQIFHGPKISRPDRPPLFGFSRWAFVASGFGAGLFPVWPGTIGSLVGAAFGLALTNLPPFTQAVCVGLLFVIGIPICGRAGRDLNDPDHSIIVLDEIVGMSAVTLLAPSGWGWLLVSFIAFRLFDIVKPWPISLVDRRLRNGLGVMLDDALAAACAAGCIALLHVAVLSLGPA